MTAILEYLFTIVLISGVMWAITATSQARF
jgi:hypothetical protein